jgi:hypothetical protein
VEVGVAAQIITVALLVADLKDTQVLQARRAEQLEQR